MLRDGELSATDFIEIALSGLASEPEIATLTIISGQLATAVELYSNPKKRDGARLRVGNAFEKMIATATPGGDHQLQLVKSFTSFASSAEHNDLLKDFLAGKLPGLKIDPEMRWSLVIALSERGLLSDDQLTEQLKLDQTLTGELSYQTALAARPTQAAKAAVWQELTTAELSTSQREAKLAGFVRPLHRPLLAAFVDPYFELLLEIWGKKSYEVASKFVSGLYPIYLTNQEILDKTNAWLTGVGKDGQVGLRRLVIEGKDSLERALTVQLRD
jgi:aminopeptidase N